jgi:zinc/manganese transport system substrate-binding protein
MHTSFRRTLLSRSLVVPVALLAAACGGDDTSEGASAASDTTPSVLATTSIWADVVASTTCGELEVGTVVPTGVDAHEFEPSVQDADQLMAADLVVANGLGLEEGLEDSLATATDAGVEVIELGPELDPVEGGHDHADDEAHEEEAHEEDEPHGEDETHGEGDAHADEDEHSTDPHVWMDPDRVAAAVPLVVTALGRLDGLPLGAEELQRCADDYVAELTALAEEMDEQLGALPEQRRRLVTNHEALGYLEDRFDVEVIGTVIPSTSSLGEASVRDLSELAEEMQAQGVTRVYGEVTGSDDVAAALAERVGGDVQIVALFTESLGDQQSGAASYLDMMRANLARIVDEDAAQP